jgi:hypothetical protein
MQADTENTKAEIADSSPAAVVPAGSSAGGDTNTSVNSVTYNSNNVPDRTMWQVTPAFGF